MRSVCACLAAALAAAAVAAPSDAAQLRVKNLRVLVVLYRGAEGDKDRLSDSEVSGTLAAVERGRRFYFRNTAGRLNLETVPMVIETTSPPNEGPTMEFIESDLRARGVADDEYDGVYITGLGLTGNWGGFRMLGNAGGCCSGADRREGLTWWPDTNPQAWYGACWLFTHEFQHALDFAICGDDWPQMLHGHPYADFAESHFTWGHQGAQHFSWIACTLREFGDRVVRIRGAREEWLTVEDRDGDGLADDDPRLPLDEVRFGSDPGSHDTDGDGLGDLGEFTSDIYLGSDPRNSDTDRDGIPDGADRYPTVAIATAVSYADAPPVIDGLPDAAYTPFLGLVTYQDGQALADAKVDACWNEDGLYLFAYGGPMTAIYLEIDSSPENGYWEGGDTYLVRAMRDGQVVFADLGLSGPVPGASAAAGEDCIEVFLPALIGQGVSNEINFGGQRRPEDIADGLRLEAGGEIAVNLTLESNADRALFMPMFDMFSTRLHRPIGAPPKPSLRRTEPITAAVTPVAVVSGVGPADHVVVVDEDGAVLGERVGAGPVLLTGPVRRGGDEVSGRNVIRATARDRVSEPLTLVVDDYARAPSLSREDDRLVLVGEPGAAVEVLVGRGAFPAQSVGAVVLDESGNGELPLPTSFDGFLGAYSKGVDFGPAVFSRIDPAIEFNYEAGTCDPRLPGDGFCIVWEGFLDVPADGSYTFYLSTDDGSRLYLDGEPIIDNWGHHAVEERSAVVTLTAGTHHLRVLYYEDYGWAAAHLEWSGPEIARTHRLPVRALPFDASEATWFARQTDRAGNVSPVVRLPQ